MEKKKFGKPEAKQSPQPSEVFGQLQDFLHPPSESVEQSRKRKQELAQQRKKPGWESKYEQLTLRQRKELIVRAEADLAGGEKILLNLETTPYYGHGDREADIEHAKNNVEFFKKKLERLRADFEKARHE